MASFRKLKSGWQYRISYKLNGEYKEKSETGFKTKAEAKIAAAEIETQIKHGAKIDKSDMLFPVYMRNWYETFRKGKKSERNDEDLERSVKFAEKYFSCVKMKELDRMTYQKALNEYGETHATASVSKRHIYMKACIQDAIQEGVIFKDPTYKAIIVGKKAGKEDEEKYIGFDDAQKIGAYFLKGIDDFEYISRHMILFALATGCRLGEVYALTWDRITFDRDKKTKEIKSGTVHIKRSWDYRYGHAGKFIPTKNKASIRSITIDKTTAQWLDKLHTQQGEYFLKNGLREKWQKTPFVFVNKRLEKVTDNAINKALKRACKKFGATEITYHGLRHTHASILLYKKIDIGYVSRRLGHSSINTTYKVYTHIIDELAQRDSKAAMRVADDLFQRADQQTVAAINK
ncbi:site-specific integrase [Sporolactobacillus terrae]|uniref:Integrase n=1 Tax=Sporolactobacillus terrae TaxID=269673 RepID=A0A5K7WZP1_9BACL|nr:site-specific integrase [Sporolactobacillus terrae]BBN99199.1 integrase [Sporolactobacillus terrae]